MFTSRKIKVINNSKADKFYCDMCNYPFLTKNDFMTSEEYKCCYECYLNFAESRKNEWKKGWRPKQEVIDNYIENRKKLYEKEKIK